MWIPSVLKKPGPVEPEDHGFADNVDPELVAAALQAVLEGHPQPASGSLMGQ